MSSRERVPLRDDVGNVIGHADVDPLTMQANVELNDSVAADRAAETMARGHPISISFKGSLSVKNNTVELNVEGVEARIFSRDSGFHTMNELRAHLTKEGLMPGVERELVKARILAAAENVEMETLPFCRGCGRAEGEKADQWDAAAPPHVVAEIIETAALEVDTLSFELDQATSDLAETQRSFDGAVKDLTTSCFEAQLVKNELAEMQSTFDLRWDATQRAIKLWQKATGRTEVWPDHADLCVWLMEEWDRLRNDGFLGEIQSMRPEDLEHVRDARQSQLDDLKDTWEDTA